MWAIIGTFVTQYVWSAFIGALPAPTSTSSTMYNFWFKFLNLLAANIARASSTHVENSPNWTAAVQKASDLGQVPKAN
jgi:hypothetical protein